MKVSIETVTPAMARIYLSKNTKNRYLRQNIVKYYSDMLVDGKWMLTHQGIAFDTRGRLLDGQHRLHAIAQSNVPAQLVISRDVDPETFKVLDSGLNRTLKDRTDLSGAEISISTTLYRLGENDSTKNKVPVDRLMDYYRAFEDEIKAVAHVGSRKSISTAYVAAAVVLQLKHGNGEALNQYAAMVKVIPTEMTPATAGLFKKLMDTSTANSSQRERYELFARVHKSLDPAHSKGRSVNFRDIDKYIADLRIDTYKVVHGAPPAANSDECDEPLKEAA